MMKLLLFIFLISSTSYAITDNQVKACNAKIQISNAIEKLNAPNCSFAQGLAKNLEVQDFHRNKIYEKLSEKLALQIEQNLEETALLAQYYTANKMELLPSGESRVKKNCRLDIVGEIETCHGKINPNDPSYKFRLNLLKSKINNSLTASCPKKDLSLQEILGSKVRHILGVPTKDNAQCEEEKNSCPIRGVSGAFTLSAQLDNESAQEFIDLIQNPKISDERIKTFFNAYPQFKLIKSTEGNLKNEFIGYLKAFKKDQGTAKEFINQFFFNNQGNQQQLSDTLANQCANLNNNLETFLCSKDLEGDQLASLESPASISLFGLNPDLKDKDIFDDAPGDGENFYAAYGFQCLAKTQKEQGIKLNRENSVDAWFNNFTKNTRPQTILNKDVKASNNKFCSIYKCEEENVKLSSFCKNGGPITSDGLKNIFDCEHKSCRTDILKYISYMEGIKKIASVQSGIVSKKESLNNDSSLSSSESKPRYSAFLENYLGVKGTLLAEGKEITPIAIAEKSKEMAERKPEPIPSSRETKISETKYPQFASANAFTSIPDQKIDQNDFSRTTASSQFEPLEPNENNTSSAVKRSRPTHTKTLAEKDSSNNLNSANGTDRDSEIKKMRSELEALANSMKGSEADKLAAITDANSRYSQKSLGDANQSDLSKGLSNVEKERNDQYQKNLASWESRLRNWQSDLSDRESRTPSNSSDAINSKRAENNESTARSNRNDAQMQLTSADKEKVKQLKAGATGAAGSADSLETAISSDDLANLKIESLKKLGINSKSAFIIKVRHQQKYYNVSVKTFSYNGKDILVPLLNESNSTLSKIVLESPLFSEYKQLQLERQQERKIISTYQ